MLDGIGMGIGFTIAITIIAFFRELLGSGTLFDKQLFPLTAYLFLYWAPSELL